MCKLASFFHNPATGEVKVWALNEHGETEKKLGLSWIIFCFLQCLSSPEFSAKNLVGAGEKKIIKKRLDKDNNT